MAAKDHDIRQSPMETMECRSICCKYIPIILFG